MLSADCKCNCRPPGALTLWTGDRCEKCGGSAADCKGMHFDATECKCVQA